jgi:hypothetical protein
VLNRLALAGFYHSHSPERLDMVDKSGKTGSKMAILGSTLQIFQILGCLLHIWALVLNSTKVYLRCQGPIRLSWGGKRVRVWHFLQFRV